MASPPESTSPTRWALTRLTRPFGRPVHPVIASVAVGCWLASIGFDVVSNISDTEFVYARGAYLLTALGVAAAVVAALTGLVDLVAVDRGSPAYRTGVRHLLAMDVALVLFTVSFLVRRTSEFRFHDPTALPATTLSVAGAVSLAVGLWYGGRLVYAHGVGAVGASDTPTPENPDPDPDSDDA